MTIKENMTKDEIDVQWLTAQEDSLWRDWLSLLSKFPTALNRQLMEDSELTLADYEVLVRLKEEPDQRLRVAALASEMRWERSRLSHQVGRMVKRGLVDKATCSEDGRGAWVHLTPMGAGALEKAAPGHVGIVRELLIDVLDEESKNKVAEALRLVSEAVDQRLGESS